MQQDRRRLSVLKLTVTVVRRSKSQRNTDTEGIWTLEIRGTAVSGLFTFPFQSRAATVRIVLIPTIMASLQHKKNTLKRVF